MARQADNDEPFSMVQGACDSYEVRSLPDGPTEIRIVIPPRFSVLWLVKLSDPRGTLAEAVLDAEPLHGLRSQGRAPRNVAD